MNLKIKLKNFETPLCLLSRVIKENKLTVIFLRNNKKIIAKLKAFDKHFNLILENIREVWNERNQKGKIVFRERNIGKMILRGDSIILLLPLNISEDSHKFF
jgi:small nuclear ribonucleoprotein (snRNP)-like protein